MNGGGENQMAQKRYSKAEATANYQKANQAAKWYAVPDFSIENMRRTNFLAA